MSEIDYEARVAKGIALLDEKVPGWVGKIDLERLNIYDGTRCVTAQLSGCDNYSAGMRLLGLEDGEHNNGSYTAHGFNAESEHAPRLPPNYSQDAAYAALTKIWRREITARQSD